MEVAVLWAAHAVMKALTLLWAAAAVGIFCWVDDFLKKCIETLMNYFCMCIVHVGVK